MESAFRDTINMEMNATDIPNLSSVTDMFAMFWNAKIMNANTSIASWDTSNITNMINVFRDTQNFNQDISSWNTSKVTTFSKNVLECPSI